MIFFDSLCISSFLWWSDCAVEERLWLDAEHAPQPLSHAHAFSQLVQRFHSKAHGTGKRLCICVRVYPFKFSTNFVYLIFEMHAWTTTRNILTSNEISEFRKNVVECTHCCACDSSHSFTHPHKGGHLRAFGVRLGAWREARAIQPPPSRSQPLHQLERRTIPVRLSAIILCLRVWR